ncbi:hypothetical protein EB820_05415 [Brevibacillus agri]|uniref:Uncharacterized protein n=1 Tax=Brevibacillus agri TaxID=51101 RepID=A0A3M8B753_9BACL|nr:hypothetical protein EB820_05415 [Brevibacillus agri]
MILKNCSDRLRVVSLLRACTCSVKRSLRFCKPRKRFCWKKACFKSTASKKRTTCHDGRLFFIAGRFARKKEEKHLLW